MRKSPSSSAPSCACVRCFEPARLQAEFLAVAYEQLVPGLRLIHPAAQATAGRSATRRPTTVPVSSYPQQGVRA